MGKRKLFFLSVVGILVVLVGFYLLPDEKIKSDFTVSAEDNFPNIEEKHFAKMPITYSVDLFEGNYFDVEPAPVNFVKDFKYTVYTMNREKKIEDIRLAFQIVSDSTDGLIEFEEVNSSEEADIRVYGISAPEMGDLLNEGYNESTDSDDILGLAIRENNTNIIENASIYFQPITSLYINEANWLYGRCTEKEEVFPETEVHEILHALGMGHQLDSFDQILFPMKVRCKGAKINDNIVSCLKKIYSNGEFAGDCSELNINPYEEDTSESYEDFAWKSTPITYAIHGCSKSQTDKIKDSVEDISGLLGQEEFLYYRGNKSANINFLCDVTFETNVYYPNSEYWFPKFELAMKSDYLFNDAGEIVEANVTLYYPDICLTSMNYLTGPTQFESFAVYRAIGLRNNYGSDFDQVTCADRGLVFSSITKERIDELYGFN